MLPKQEKKSVLIQSIAERLVPNEEQKQAVKSLKSTKSIKIRLRETMIGQYF